MMQDEQKTKAELLQDLDTLRRHISELEQTEQRLKDSEKQFKELFENAPCVILTVKPDGTILFLNRTVPPYTAEKAVGTSVYDYVPPEYQDTLRDALERVLRTGEPYSYEIAGCGPDGRTSWYQSRLGPIKKDGQVVALTLIATDVTEHKQAEFELRQSEHKYRTLLENLPQKIFLKDRNSVYLSCNENVAKDFKIKAEEIVGKTDYDLVPKELAEKYRADDKRIMESGQTQDIEERYIQDGQEVIIHTVKTPVKDDQGNVIGVLGIFWDITERKKAEEKIKQIAEQWSVTFDSITDLVSIQSRDFKIVKVNKAFADLSKLKPDELIGRFCYEVIHCTKEPWPTCPHKRVLETGKPATIEFFEPNLGIYLQVSTSPIFDDSGEITGTVHIVKDITERKQAEEALREEKARAQKYLDVAGVMFLVVNANGTVELINRRGCEILGYSEEEIIGKKWFDTFIAEPIRKEVRGVFKKLMAGKIEPVEYYENPVITKSGEERLIAWHNTILKDEHGNIIGSLSSAVDITERKKAEEALKEGRERLGLALAAANMGTWRWNIKTDQDTRDASFNHILGLKAAESTQSVKDFVQHVHPDDRAAVDEEIKRAIREHDIYSIEFRIVRPDGTIHWLSDRGKVYYDQKNEPAYMTGAVFDITRRKQMEEALREYREKMARVERLTSFVTLSAALFHELTQPLTVINLLIENALTELETAPYSDTVAKKLRDILTEVSRVNSVAHRFRDAVKKSSERIIEQVDLKAVAERTTKLFGENARRAKVTLHLTDFDKLPPIYANEEELSQVFFALVDNAIQAACPTDEPVRRKPLEGGPLGRRADGKKSHQLVISGIQKEKRIELRFSDNCSGIAPEHLDKIFQPFFTTKPTDEATGLGLCIVEHFVLRTGGNIRVESKLGEGTTFYVTLPINIYAK